MSPKLALAIVLAAFAAYGPALGHFFQTLDDPTLLWCARELEDATPHARPLYVPWNALCYRAFGTRAPAWNAAGLLVHAANALLVARLAAWVSRSALAALAAGLAFAVLYSPHEAVMWVAANCGLLALFCVLLSGAFWCAFLDAGRKAWYAAALGALILAMGFKEESVVACPLWLGLDLVRNGRRALAPRRFARVYALPALAAAAYLSIAFRPGLWRDAEAVGRYAFDASLGPKLLRSFALVFWPRTAQPESAWIPPAVGLALALGAAAWGWRARVGGTGKLALFGLALALCGLMPALPGPFHVAGTRYSYPASAGAAMLVAAALATLLSRSRSAGPRAALWTCFALWLAINALALRSVARWRFGNDGERLQRLVRTSEAVLAARPAVVVGPAVHNAHDLALALCVWHAVPRSEVVEDAAPLEAVLSGVRPGGDLDPRRVAVFACAPDGEIGRLGPEDQPPSELWTAIADARERSSRGRAVALLWVRGRP